MWSTDTTIRTLAHPNELKQITGASCNHNAAYAACCGTDAQTASKPMAPPRSLLGSRRIGVLGELSSTRDYKCSHCGSGGASIQCCSCRKKMHLHCMKPAGCAIDSGKHKRRHQVLKSLCRLVTLCRPFAGQSSMSLHADKRKATCTDCAAATFQKVVYETPASRAAAGKRPTGAAAPKATTRKLTKAAKAAQPETRKRGRAPLGLLRDNLPSAR